MKDNITDINAEIDYINEQHGIHIEKVQKEWTQEVIEDLKGWWKILQARRSWEIYNQRRKEIEENIEKRCQMIDGEQGRMLSSLLEKPNMKVQIDRLVKKVNCNRELVIEPEEVLSKTKKHYQNQFRARRFDQKICNDRWIEIYKPKNSIQEGWYKNLN